LETEGTAASTKTDFYIGNYEEEVIPLGNVRKIHYFSGAIYNDLNGSWGINFGKTLHKIILILLLEPVIIQESV
jgi:hypothetical protein